MAIYNNCPIISVGNIPAGQKMDYKTHQMVPTSPSVDIGVLLPNGQKVFLKLWTTEKAKPYTQKKLASLGARYVGRMPVFPDEVYQRGISVIEKPDNRNPERMQYDLYIPQQNNNGAANPSPRAQQQHQYGGGYQQKPQRPTPPPFPQQSFPAHQEYPPQPEPEDNSGYDNGFIPEGDDVDQVPF